MDKTSFQGNPVSLYGELPKVGEIAPSFNLTGAALDEIRNSDFEGKKIVINVFPSLDTPVCATSVRKFNVEASKLPDTVVLCVSMDLPFAMGRFCSANEIDNVVPASAFRSPEFGEEYGMLMENGPLRGLLARCVIVVGEDGKVKYTEMVPDITSEPDYAAALDAVRK